MTQTQTQFINRLKEYFDNRDDNNYSAVMSRAQKDNHFEQMVQTMTVDRLAGGNTLIKNNIRFSKGG